MYCERIMDGKMMFSYKNKHMKNYVQLTTNSVIWAN